MPSNLTVANAVLKIGYGDIHEQLDDYLVALQKVESGSQKLTFGGVQAQFAIHVGRNQGIGALSEFDDLPEAGQNSDAVASLFLKNHYGRVQGTGQVFKQVQSAPEAFVDWMKREVDTIKDSLQRDLNRQVYGDGTGTIATLTATATASATVTVDDSHWLEEGMYINVLTQGTLTNTTPTQGNSALLTITAVDPTTNIITFSGGTVTAATGSVLVRASLTRNNWKREWEGLGLIISTSSTLHGINPSTTTKWKAGYVANSVGTLTELAMTHLVQGIKQKGGNVTDFLTTYGIANAYWNTLQGMRRYDGGDVSKGGVQVPVFQSVAGDIPFTLDWSAPTGTIHAINTKEMFLHQAADWDWMNMTGSMWQQVPNKDAYSATMFKYSNIGVTRRNSFGKLTGITEL